MPLRRHAQSLPARRISSRQSSVVTSPRRRCSSGVMSGTSTDLALGRRAVTITGFRSSSTFQPAAEDGAGEHHLRIEF